MLRAERLSGGLRNDNRRVWLSDGGSCVLRGYAGGPEACRLEVALAARLVGSVPVARFLHAAPDEAWAVLAWVDGVLLPELRRGPDAAEVGRALGRVLAEVGSIAFAHPGRLTSALAIEPSTTSWGATMHAALASDALAARVDRARQHALNALVDAHADEVADATDGVARLVHGDFRGNNVLVRRDAGGAWHVAAVLDWEAARSGSPLADVGLALRYRRPAFEAGFAAGLADGGAPLAPAWRRVARLLDLAGMCAALARPELPAEIATGLAELAGGALDALQRASSP